MNESLGDLNGLTEAFSRTYCGCRERDSTIERQTRMSGECLMISGELIRMP